MLRTEYRRCAFQSSAHNQVRISLDTELVFLREAGAPRRSGDWCRDTTAPVGSGDQCRFPHAILEIKLVQQVTPRSPAPDAFQRQGLA